MILTLTNNTAVTFNEVAVHTGGSGATGGALKNPLPYPFAHVPPLAPAGVLALPIHEADMRYKRVPWLTFEARDQWNTILAAWSKTGANLAMVLSAETMTVPAAGRFELEERLINAI